MPHITLEDKLENVSEGKEEEEEKHEEGDVSGILCFISPFICVPV